MGQVVAVVSGKGGTGKTSISAAVASCLATLGQSVLSVDCDVGMRNLDLALAMSQDATMDFSQAMGNVHIWEFIPKHPRIPNLSMLTAPVTLRPEQVDEAGFARFLQEARQRYDWIFLDAPAGIGSGFSWTIAPADLVLLVTSSDPASLRDGGRAVEEIDLLGEKPIKLIVNRVSTGFFRKIHFTVDDAMDALGLPLLGLVPEDPNVQIASVKQVPLVFQTTRGAAVACLKIARRLMGFKVPMARYF